jgi:hypothetical protein
MFMKTMAVGPFEGVVGGVAAGVARPRVCRRAAVRERVAGEACFESWRVAVLSAMAAWWGSIGRVSCN